MENNINNNRVTFGDEFYEFLGKTKPNRAIAYMKLMMNDLKITSSDAVRGIKKDYIADVIACDKVQNETIKM